MLKLPRFSASFAIGVGNNPDPISFVRGADGERRYTIPLSITPALGQVPENSSHPISKQRCHVLHDCVARSYQANGSHKFPVESRTGSGKTGALSCVRYILTGEAADDDIGFAWSEFSGGDVIVAGDPWKVFGEDFSTERIDLAERDGSHSGSFEPEAETADSTKEVEDIGRHSHSAWFSAASSCSIFALRALMAVIVQT